MLAVIAWLTFCGGQCALRTLRIGDRFLAWSLGFPLGLCLLLAVCQVLDLFLPLWVCLLIALVAVRFCYSRHTPPPVPESREPFSTPILAVLSLILLFSLFFQHAQQLCQVSPDFWHVYPQSRTLYHHNLPSRDAYSPSQPYLHQMGRVMITAVLANCVGKDTLRTHWILQLLLQINAFALWLAALRAFFQRALPAALGTLLVFVGSGVGQYTGLLDAYSSCTLDMTALAALGALYLSIGEQAKRHLPISFSCCLITAIATFSALSCSPHLALPTLLTFIAVSIFHCLRRHTLVGNLGRAVATLLLCTIAVGATQFQTWKQLQLVNSQKTWQPKLSTEHLLHADISTFNATDASGVAPMINSYHALAQLTDANYHLLFSPQLLRWHSLPTWLAPLTLFWILRRRYQRGLLMWLFAIALFLVSGLVEIGPFTSRLHWSWHYAANALWACLLGILLADAYHWLSDRESSAARIMGQVFLSLALCLCCARAASLSASKLGIYCGQKHFLSNALIPIYPATDTWISQQPNLALNSGERELANWIWEHNEQSARVFFDLPSGDEDALNHLALLAGQAGCFPLGCHYDSYKPEAKPLLPQANAIAFREQHDIYALAAMGTQLLASQQSLKLPEQSDGPVSLTLEQVINSLHNETDWYIYRVASTYPWDSSAIPFPAPQIEITLSSPPQNSQAVPGVCYSAVLSSNKPLQGWVRPMLRDAREQWTNELEPLSFYMAGTQASIYWVYPYQEGNYQLSWLYYPDDQPDSCQRLTGSTAISPQFSRYLEQCLRWSDMRQDDPNTGTFSITNISEQAFEVACPLQLRWQVWDADLHGYRPSHKSDCAPLPTPLAAGQSATIKWKTSEPMTPGCRLDVSLSTPYGQTFPITRQ